ncbi:MAG: hypothetical protein ACPG4T_24010 [Nannocystaceae bacterium]
MKDYENLHELREQLRQIIPDADKFNFIAIRLMLRTGVNIKQPASRHLSNPVTVKRVAEVIRALGFEM